jgi:hypothetical protein
VRRLAAAFTSASLLAPKQTSAKENGGKPPHSMNRRLLPLIGAAPVRL